MGQLNIALCWIGKLVLRNRVFGSFSFKSMHFAGYHLLDSVLLAPLFIDDGKLSWNHLTITYLIMIASFHKIKVFI